MDLNKQIAAVSALAISAGSRILEIARSGELGVELKNDDSPLTLADKASHEVITDGLARLSELPVLSEEAADVPWTERQTWDRYWLVDPLDGTKEFIKKNGEYTVNIALIEDGVAVLGVVYVPVKKILYYGARGLGAYKVAAPDGPSVRIGVAEPPHGSQYWKIVGSRSYRSEGFSEFVKQFDQPQVLAVGSSLKFCLVAEGAADLYPRLGLTSEWDTAAAQAIVEAAGGMVLDWESGGPLRYNTKASLLNPPFITCAGISPVWSGGGFSSRCSSSHAAGLMAKE